MPTLIFLHAHPDDEASQTSGTMALASDKGYRVVVVYATNGDHGTVPPDLRSGETVADRRQAEATESARIIGVHRVEWLGYRDSGMNGWAQNGDPDCFAQADVDEAAARLAAILDEEDADVLVGYDWHGTYGHPDHVKVHTVAYRAAELAAHRPRVIEETRSTDADRLLFAQAREVGLDFGEEQVGDDGLPMGVPASDINWRVDVSGVLDRKRAALAAHASQEDARALLGLPAVVFDAWMSSEYYREDGLGRPLADGWPF
ncbi:PIG-L family deacetylase [Brooklawnia cerclae]|uniref:LmbE family N-acetylglucosaminyl deacetylase n=1 Tax=Brooklawnia cerclae TaxID=349934 RepID=A0ABX0SFU1_9ACTN|nr:LmbE family N-acetylglucosaminyl deacetylase [Brooklawnia cerclae]